MNIPQQLAKGDFVEWTDDVVPDSEGNLITSAIWTLKFALRHPTASGLDLTAVANGEGWKTSISIAQSGGLSVGIYYWSAFFQNDPSAPTKKISYTTGEINITANIALATNFDGRTQLEKDVAAVELAITNVAAGNAVQSYTVGSRAIHRMSMADLIKLRAHLKYRLALEKKADSIKNGLGDPHNVFVRFNK